MSTERMTDVRAVALREILEAHGWTYAQAEEAWAEFDRARREETQQQDRIHALEVQQADLLRHVREKDEHIKALADALENIRGYDRTGRALTIRDRMEIDAALRLVGRLK